ncbi:hypothetical protein Pelo_17001 [Pelomyxa schiedti]|nr:hypothetical protein Pelo_17001 [Pelomyxa schiedti]
MPCCLCGSDILLRCRKDIATQPRQTKGHDEVTWVPRVIGTTKGYHEGQGIWCITRPLLTATELRDGELHFRCNNPMFNATSPTLACMLGSNTDVKIALGNGDAARLHRITSGYSISCTTTNEASKLHLIA